MAGLLIKKDAFCILSYSKGRKSKAVPLNELLEAFKKAKVPSSEWFMQGWKDANNIIS